MCIWFCWANIQFITIAAVATAIQTSIIAQMFFFCRKNHVIIMDQNIKSNHFKLNDILGKIIFIMTLIISMHNRKCTKLSYNRNYISKEMTSFIAINSSITDGNVSYERYHKLIAHLLAIFVEHSMPLNCNMNGSKFGWLVF